MDNIKINGMSFPNVEYIAIPKADNSGNAMFRNINFEKRPSLNTVNIEDVIYGNIEYDPAVADGDTLVLPNDHILATIVEKKSVSRSKTITIL